MTIVDILDFLERWYLWSTGDPVRKSENALRIGILSTANVNTVAILNPAKTHPDVIVSAVASRNLDKAEKYAKLHGIPKAYGSYEELLAEPGIDAVYIPLPNSMHYEWTKKSLMAGKHVLCEKPFTSNAAEARELVALAVQKNLIMEEAFHWQFHPAAHTFAELVKENGNVVRTYAEMTAPKGSVPDSDVRMQYDLSGGSIMDLTYVLSATRFFLKAGEPSSIQSVEARRALHDERVDTSMRAKMTFSVDGREVQSEIYGDLARPPLYGLVPRIWDIPYFRAETDTGAILTFSVFPMPAFWHSICIERNGKKTYHKAYTRTTGKWANRGSDRWTTYRWQLEAFVDQIRKREPIHWVSLQDSIDQMATIDSLYRSAGIAPRPSQV